MYVHEIVSTKSNSTQCTCRKGIFFIQITMGRIPFYRDRELQEDSRNGHFQKVIEDPRRPSKEEERERED